MRLKMRHHFELNVARFINPFDIDYSVNATRNISLRDLMWFHPLRNLTKEYLKYALFIGTGETEYKLIDFEPSSSVSSGTVTIIY